MTCPHCTSADPGHDRQRCPKRPLGPNMSADAVPAGGGIGSAVAFIMDSARMAASARLSMGKAAAIVALIRSAPGFADLGLPDDTEETIAGELVRRIDERVAEQQAARSR